MTRRREVEFTLVRRCVRLVIWRTVIGARWCAAWMWPVFWGTIGGNVGGQDLGFICVFLFVPLYVTGVLRASHTKSCVRRWDGWRHAVKGVQRNVLGAALGGRVPGL